MSLCSASCLFWVAVLIAVAATFYPLLSIVPSGIHENDRGVVWTNLVFGKCISAITYTGEWLGFGDNVLLFANMMPIFSKIMISKPKIPDDIEARSDVVAGIPVRILRRRSQSGEPKLKPAVIYYHGGWWILGQPEMYDEVLVDFLKEIDMIIVAVRYRLAPQNPYPIPLTDCETVTVHILRHPRSLLIDGSRVALAGDSAGGNLAAAVALKLRQQPDIQRAKLQVLVYPALQAFDLGTPSYTDKDNQLGLNTDMMVSFWLYYMTGGRDFKDDLVENKHTDARSRSSEYSKFTSHDNLPRKMLHRDFRARAITHGNDTVWLALGKYITDPFVCPLMANDLSGLPKALLLTAGYDVLRDDGFFYAKRLKESGNDVTHMHYKDTVHGAFSIPSIYVGKRMRNDVISYVKEHL